MTLLTYTRTIGIFIVVAMAMAITLFGLNPITYQYLIYLFAILVAFFILVRHLDSILSALGFTIRLGDIEIADKIAYITNKTYSPIDAPVTGIMAVKLIPTSPVMDATEDDKKKIIGTVEQTIYSLPTPSLYCFYKTSDDYIFRQISELQRRMEILSRKQNKTEAEKSELEDIQTELRRLRESTPVAGVMFLMLYIHGTSIADVRDKARKIEENIQSIASSLNCSYKVLRGVELRSLLEHIAIDRVFRWE